MKYINLNLGSFTEANINLVDNSYVVEDTYFFPSSNRGNFSSIYSMENSVYTKTNKEEDGILGEIRFNNVNMRIDTQVQIYNFFDLIAQIGGVYELIFQFIGILGFYVSSKIYEYTLVNALNSNYKNS